MELDNCFGRGILNQQHSAMLVCDEPVVSLVFLSYTYAVTISVYWNLVPPQVYFSYSIYCYPAYTFQYQKISEPMDEIVGSITNNDSSN